MAERLSRYRAVPGMAPPPDAGAAAAPPVTPELRPLPAAGGTLRHVVRAGERLDHLAATYYGRPAEWWRICDANPEFLSPLALVGAEPVGITEVPLQPSAEPPPWDRLLPALSALVGVRRVEVVEELEVRPERRSGPRGEVTVLREVPVRVLHVTRNRAEVGADEITAVILRFAAVGPVTEHGRVGQQIVVPPPATGTEGR